MVGAEAVAHAVAWPGLYLGGSADLLHVLDPGGLAPGADGAGAEVGF